jgi:hypothetical protein
LSYKSDARILRNLPPLAVFPLPYAAKENEASRSEEGVK